MSTTKPAMYKEKQKVFVSEESLDTILPYLYEATIRKVVRGPRPEYPSSSNVADSDATWCWFYFVHYTGWAVKWDKWVPEAEVVAWSEETVKTSKERKSKANKKNKNNKRKQGTADSEEDSKNGAAAAALIKQKEEEEKAKQLENLSKKARAVEERKTFLEENDLEEDELTISSIQLPFSLKKIMIDEYDRIVQKAVSPATGYPQRMVADLPVPKNSHLSIRSVLEEYRDSKRTLIKEQLLHQKKDVDSDEYKNMMKEWDEMIDGTLQFFDDALPMFILYRQEFPQYQNMLTSSSTSYFTQDQTHCDIYGCEFLLRMIVRLPTLIRDYGTLNNNTPTILSKMSHLVNFLQKQQMKYFKQSYRPVMEEELMDEEIQALNYDKRYQKWKFGSNNTPVKSSSSS